MTYTVVVNRYHKAGVAEIDDAGDCVAMYYDGRRYSPDTDVMVISNGFESRRAAESALDHYLDTKIQ